MNGQTISKVAALFSMSAAGTAAMTPPAPKTTASEKPNSIKLEGYFKSDQEAKEAVPITLIPDHDDRQNSKKGWKLAQIDNPNFPKHEETLGQLLSDLVDLYTLEWHKRRQGLSQAVPRVPDLSLTPHRPVPLLQKVTVAKPDKLMSVRDCLSQTAAPKYLAVRRLYRSPSTDQLQEGAKSAESDKSELEFDCFPLKFPSLLEKVNNFYDHGKDDNSKSFEDTYTSSEQIKNYPPSQAGDHYWHEQNYQGYAVKRYDAASGTRAVVSHGIPMTLKTPEVHGESEVDFKPGSENEIDILKKMDHPNVQKFQEAFREPGSEPGSDVFVVSDYTFPGEESTSFAKELQQKEKIIKPIAFQILSAISYLHNKNIMHANLNSDNIVMGTRLDKEENASYISQVVGFEYAQKIENPKKRIQRARVMGDYPSVYMSPEQALGRYSEKCDLYSFGVLVLTMFMGEKDPLGDKDLENLIRQEEIDLIAGARRQGNDVSDEVQYLNVNGVSDEDFAKGEKQHRMRNALVKFIKQVQEKYKISNAAARFLENLLKPEDSRPTAKATLENPWFKGLTPEDSELKKQEADGNARSLVSKSIEFRKNLIEEAKKSSERVSPDLVQLALFLMTREGAAVDIDDYPGTMTAFHTIDENKDGILSRGEFDKVFPDSDPENETDSSFEAFDFDNNGSIGWTEFAAMSNARRFLKSVWRFEATSDNMEAAVAAKAWRNHIQAEMQNLKVGELLPGRFPAPVTKSDVDKAIAFLKGFPGRFL